MGWRCCYDVSGSYGTNIQLILTHKFQIRERYITIHLHAHVCGHSGVFYTSKADVSLALYRYSDTARYMEFVLYRLRTRGVRGLMYRLRDTSRYITIHPSRYSDTAIQRDAIASDFV